MKYIIAYDLGTGGTKTSLFDENGKSCGSSFYACETSFPQSGWHEQRPEDWWHSVVVSTRGMLKKTGVDVKEIVALAVSGHSLGVVPVSRDGRLLADTVPIWSDSRAGDQAAAFFEKVPETDWYMTTGAGFPAPLYSLFKIMWYRDNAPELYAAAHRFVGTKDYVNWKMTGVLCTDRSYASGSGAWDLREERYREDYIRAAGINPDKLPTVYPSTHVVGTLLPEAAAELGLDPATKVCAGGVDNACMALGAACIGEGEAYTSLGTSAWIAVSSSRPIVNPEKRPYVFAHCVPGMFVSATSIFSAGNSYRWARDTLCPDLVKAEQEGGPNAYAIMDQLAAESPAGAKRLIFNPSLAGGSGLDKSDKVRGCFTGLELMHSRGDMLRAVLEGVCMNLRLAMDVLAEYAELSDTMLIVGGGGKSRFWRGLFASIYEKNVLETNVGQDAGSLGAAAVAAVGAGLWQDFTPLRGIHERRDLIPPDPELVRTYQRMLPAFARIADLQSDIGDMLAAL